jgi:hypothetical protein
MDDSPYINDGADTSLRKTVSLLNKIEAKTGVGGTGSITGPVKVTPYSGALTKSAVATVYVSNPNATAVFPQNPNRKYLLVQNLSGQNNVVLGFGSIPSPTNNGILLSKNGGGVTFESSFTPTDSVYVVLAEYSVTSTAPIVAYEG